MAPRDPTLRPRFQSFDPLVEAAESMPYWDRRLWLWHKFRPRPPRFLYRYQTLDVNNQDSLQRLRDVIVRSRLWLSSVDDFNDLFDMSAVMQVSDKIALRKARVSAMLKGQGLRWNKRKKAVPAILARTRYNLPHVLQKIYEENRVKMGVCCFTEDPRSILMWSHYSGHHTGVCLQFEVAGDPATLLQAVPVEYSTQYPIIDWTVEDNFPVSLMKAVLRKHDGWSYEREHRIVIADGARRHQPYVANALTGIIFGSRAAEPVIDAVKRILTEREGIGANAPRLVRACKHPREYRLLICSLTNV